MAEKLRPLDRATQEELGRIVEASGITQAVIGKRAGMSQNRVGSILRLETPPATDDEVAGIEGA